MGKVIGLRWPVSFPSRHTSALRTCYVHAYVQRGGYYRAHAGVPGWPWADRRTEPPLRPSPPRARRVRTALLRCAVRCMYEYTHVCTYSTYSKRAQIDTYFVFQYNRSYSNIIVRIPIDTYFVLRVPPPRDTYNTKYRSIRHPKPTAESGEYLMHFCN
jgi:hypothetical protein